MPVGSKMEAHLLVEGENDLHVISALCRHHCVNFCRVAQSFI